jgi:hypothetical protein
LTPTKLRFRGFAWQPKEPLSQRALHSLAPLFFRSPAYDFHQQQLTRRSLDSPSNDKYVDNLNVGWSSPTIMSKFPFNSAFSLRRRPRPSPHVDSKTHMAIPTHAHPVQYSRQKPRKVTRAVNSCIPGQWYSGGAFPILSDDLLAPASGTTRHINF